MSPDRPENEPLSFVARLFLAQTTWLRVLTDGAFARDVQALDQPKKALPDPAKPIKAAKASAEESDLSSSGKGPVGREATDTRPERSSNIAAPPESSALQLLARLQAEGRLIDFLEDPITAYSDAEIGAVARVVHEGCGRALREMLPVLPVRDEEEGARVVLPPGFDKSLHKLTGNVKGSAPFAGTLRHRGWRVAEVKLGQRISGDDPRVVAPAEVEL